MRINYKNTALGLIDDPDNFNFYFPDPQITPRKTPQELKKFGMSLINNSKSLKDACGDNINYVSGAFFDAFKKGSEKIRPLLLKEKIDEAGILITGGFTNGYTHVHTIYYMVSTVECEDGELFYQVIFIDFSKHAKSSNCTLDCYVTTIIDPNDKGIAITDALIWNGYLDEGRDAHYWQMFILSFCLFKKYCDIETKLIDPKQSRKATVAGTKYLNETDRRITVLDSTWFTNLVVSWAFGVSGHLRWQRFGPGLSEKKLIWIDEFQKEGYTRKAKVLIQNENNGE